MTPRDAGPEVEPALDLYGITDGPLSFSWVPLWSEQAASAAELSERGRMLGRRLPDVLAEPDLSSLGRDGEIDEWDRRHEGARLRWKAYCRWDGTWDHDHCVYCGATFSLDEPGR